MSANRTEQKDISLHSRLTIVTKWVYIIAVGVPLTLFFWCFALKSDLNSAILSLSMIIVFVFVAKGQSLRHIGSIGSDADASAALFFAAFAVRYGYCGFMDRYICQVSDFSRTLSEANSGLFTDAINYYRFYLHKFLYPYGLHLLHIKSQSRVLFFQCVCTALCSVVIYHIGTKVANRRVGKSAALMYILWPAHIIYTQIVTEEHLAALFTSLIVFLLIDISQKLEKVEKIKSKDSIAAIIESCLGGVPRAYVRFLRIGLQSCL